MEDKKELERLSLTIPEELKDWLYGFSREIKRAGGYKLPNTIIIRACIRAIKESGLDFDLSNIKDEQHRGLADTGANEDMENILLDRLLNAIQRKKASLKK